MFSILQIPGNIPVNDLSVTVVTILFTLSMISERISNLVKLYLPRLRNRTFRAEEEKVREQYIMTLAVGSGIITAAIAGADLFTLLSRGALVYVLDKHDGKTIIGFILSGLFISLGSKFWHDALDIVLQFSNLKKAAVEQQNQQVIADQTINDSRPDAQLKAKATLFESTLKGMSGYQGYKVRSKIQLIFEIGHPTENERDQIIQALGLDRFEIIETQQIEPNAN